MDIYPLVYMMFPLSNYKVLTTPQHTAPQHLCLDEIGNIKKHSQKTFHMYLLDLYLKARLEYTRNTNMFRIIKIILHHSNSSSSFLLLQHGLQCH